MEKKKTPKTRRPYTAPEIKSERFAERKAMACEKNQGIDMPRPGCAPPSIYAS